MINILADITTHDIHWTLKVLIALWLMGKIIGWMDLYARRTGRQRP